MCATLYLHNDVYDLNCQLPYTWEFEDSPHMCMTSITTYVTLKDAMHMTWEDLYVCDFTDTLHVRMTQLNMYVTFNLSIHYLCMWP